MVGMPVDEICKEGGLLFFLPIEEGSTITPLVGVLIIIREELGKEILLPICQAFQEKRNWGIN